MKIRDLSETPMLDVILCMQQQMSQASNEGQLLYAFIQGFRQLSGATHIMDVDVRNLPRGHYRIMDSSHLHGSDLSPELLLSDCRFHTPCRESIAIHSDDVIGELVARHVPVYGENIDPSDDPVLEPFLDGTKDVLAVPIYLDGEIAEWMLVFRPPGISLSDIEIRVVSANLNLMVRSVNQIRLNNEVSRLHERVQGQIEEIARVQQSLLPARLPEVPGIDMAVRYQPCEAAGGDYYDFRCFDDGRLGVIVADVAGHGPASAVVMAMLRTMMSAYRLFNRPPATVIEDLNRLMLDALDEGTFVTAFFVLIEPTTGEATYINAGHCRPRLRRADGTVEEIGLEGSPPIGVFEDLEQLGEDFSMAPGDLLVLYTDGVTEAWDVTHTDLFETDRLDAAIRAGDGCPESTLDAIQSAVSRHTGGDAPDDDLCMLALRYAGQ